MIDTTLQARLLDDPRVHSLKSSRGVKMLWAICLIAEPDGELLVPLAEIGRRLGWEARQTTVAATAALRRAGLLAPSEDPAARRRFRLVVPGTEATDEPR